MAAKEIMPTYQVANNGLVLPKGYPIETFYSALEYKVQSDDVFIVSYPECGSLNLQYILFLLKNEGRHLMKRQRLEDFTAHLESVGKEVIEKLQPPRIIKSHLPLHIIPYNSSAKYIYVARNAIDCCISFYKYTTDFIRYYNFHEGSFDTFFELFIDGETDFGSYFDHLLSWYKRRNEPNVLFLLCEDLNTNFRDNVKKVGKFLGGIFQEATESEQIMNDVTRMAGGESLENQKESEKADDVPKCYGKKIGDWEKYFNDEQIIRLDERIQEKWGNAGASGLWDKYFL